MRHLADLRWTGGEPVIDDDARPLENIKRQRKGTAEITKRPIGLPFQLRRTIRSHPWREADCGSHANRSASVVPQQHPGKIAAHRGLGLLLNLNDAVELDQDLVMGQAVLAIDAKQSPYPRSRLDR